MSTHPPYDCIIIGAGAGGMSAAARLVAAGYKTVLLETLPRVGGRAGSERIDGFTVNVGAIAIELGGTFEETFQMLGVPLDIREPSPATVFRIKGKTINVAKGGWGLLLGGFTKKAASIGARFADARGGDLPEASLSTEQWLTKYTRSKTVHAIFRNLCAAIFAANADELPARAFLTYFAIKGAFKRFGFCPRGTQGIWDDLAKGIRDHGGEIRLGCAVSGLNVSDGRVTGVTLAGAEGSETLIARTVISNIGPLATARLAEEALGGDYLQRIRDTLRPAANIVVNFATREPLVAVPGLITFGRTRRLCNMGELTATCPEMAPAGWHQYVAYGVPRPALGDFDDEAETQHVLQDLRDEFPGFADARMLSVRVMRDDWPAQRSCAGFDMPQETPLANLWLVGDGVKDYGDGGTQACALTGQWAAQWASEYLARDGNGDRR